MERGQHSQEREPHVKLFARLLVSDFPAEFAFWRDAMALPVRYSDEAMGYAMFDAGGENAGLELFARDAYLAALGQPTPSQAPIGYGSVVVLSVDDADATYARVLEQGATSVAAPKDRAEWMARTAQIADPEGHLIEIYTLLTPPNTAA
jgi:predicted enzyme related to lactoylglutathione lyase